MEQAIKDFAKQFAYEPIIENASQWKPYERFVILGMGGSHLAGDLLKMWNPLLPLISHRDYGLPPLSETELKQCLIIVSSYSGNTEEPLDAFMRSRDKGYAVAAVSTGGKLLELARSMEIPFVQMPDIGIQPRLALGFSLRALLKLLGKEDALRETATLSTTLDPLRYERKGSEIAARIKGKIPLIYASSRNLPLAYTWKIKFNETGKIPAFCNVFPELNHNEMTGFDANEQTRPFSQWFYVLLLKDPNDHPRILKRMDILTKLYLERGIAVEALEISGEDVWHKMFSSLLIADWVSYYTANQYGLEAEQVPMVEEFKKEMT